MSALWGFISLEWPSIATILAGLGLLGGVTGLIASLPGLIDLWQRHSDKPKVRQITKRTDPDLVGLDELQQDEFGADVADPVGEVRSHVARSRKGRSQRDEDDHPYFLALVLKYQGVVVGYLTAEYFTHSRTIFLWYLFVDKKRLPAHKVRQRGCLLLLAAMVKAADATGVEWRHIITEVEAEPKDLPRARAKLQLFQNAAEELSRRAGRDTVRVFKLPIAYRQPILDLRWLDDPEQHEVKEWLLYAPRQLRDGLHLSGAQVLMDKSLANSLLDTLLLKAYGSAFPSSDRYRAYCGRKFAACTTDLPAEVRLSDQGDSMDGETPGPEFYSTPREAPA